MKGRVNARARGKVGVGVGVVLALISLPFGVVGCVPPAQYEAVAEAADSSPPPVTRVYFYPYQGQNQEQQDRDSYECYLWAKKQTGFDPSAPNLAPHQRVRVVPEPPPGTGTAVGAVTGALLGAAVASRGTRPEGALVGAVAGAIVGTAADAARQGEAQRLESYYGRDNDRQRAVIERQSGDYRRALGACLEGRGYTVR